MASLRNDLNMYQRDMGEKLDRLANVIGTLKSQSPEHGGKAATNRNVNRKDFSLLLGAGVQEDENFYEGWVELMSSSLMYKLLLEEVGKLHISIINEQGRDLELTDKEILLNVALPIAIKLGKGAPATHRCAAPWALPPRGHARIMLAKIVQKSRSNFLNPMLKEVARAAMPTLIPFTQDIESDVSSAPIRALRIPTATPALRSRSLTPALGADPHFTDCDSDHNTLEVFNGRSIAHGSIRGLATRNPITTGSHMSNGSTQT